MLFPVCGFDMILASTHPSKAFSRSLSVVKGDRFLTNNLAEGWPVPLVTTSVVNQQCYIKGIFITQGRCFTVLYCFSIA